MPVTNAALSGLSILYPIVELKRCQTNVNHALALKLKVPFIIYIAGPITQGASFCITVVIPLIYQKCIYL